MPEIGYHLSCEEHGPAELVGWARQAEECGFGFATISDHFHPWTDEQGQSPFVWSVLGALARATDRLPFVTAVTCPTVRIHPAIIAQAAATTASLMPGRFTLGVGSGENLNEHILGDNWPPTDIRLAMLEEAVQVIRELWGGGVVTHEGDHYVVHNARLYTLPEDAPTIVVAAAGPKAAALAGRVGDGLMAVGPSGETVDQFERAGGKGKPRYGQLHVCWAEDEADARRTALRVWPNAGIPGELGQELPMPAHFEQAAKTVGEDDVARIVVCGNDAERHLEQLRQYEQAGFTHVSVHQVGDDQDGFLRFYKDEVLPKLG